MMMRMKIKTKYLAGIALAVAVFAAVYYVTSITGFFVQTSISDKYDNFAKCLAQKGIIMAGTDWCHFCKQQKEMFGTSFQYINYKNCDKKYAGVQTLENLAKLSGCSLPQ